MKVPRVSIRCLLIFALLVCVCSCKSLSKAKAERTQDKLENGLGISIQVKEKQNPPMPYVNGNLQWDLDLELTNNFGSDISFGDDLMLLEGKPEQEYDGVYIVYHKEIPATRPGNYDHYHTAHAYALGAFVENWADGTLRGYQNAGTYELADPPEYKPRKTFCNTVLAPGNKFQYETHVKQGLWLKRDLVSTVLVVLPEIHINSPSSNYRMILVLKPSPANKSQWELNEKKVVLLEKNNLEQLLNASKSDLAMRIFALNWLAKVDPNAARPFLLQVLKDKNAGTEVVAAIQLLMDYNIAPDDEALQNIKQLAADSKSRNWSQKAAAKYVEASSKQTAAGSK